MKLDRFLQIASLALALVFTSGMVLQVDAGKPDWANDKSAKKEKKIKKDKGNKGKKNDNIADDRVTGSIYFTDRHRNVIHNYYREQYRSGHCPPGLAKKNNGCMPPGQAKKYQIGRPLPADVELYDLPDYVLRDLGTPPSGNRFVRIASDILMISVGSRMVVDAIEDLGDL